MSDFIPLEPVQIIKSTGAPKPVKDETRHNKYASARTRYFILLLYPDNPEHMDVFDWITKELQHIYVLHDRDLKEHSDDELPTDGDTDLKKAHYHVIIRFPNPRTIAGVRKYFGNCIDKFIQECSDPYATAQYMTHSTFGCRMKKKTRYSLDDVHGTTNLKKRLFSDFQSLYTEQILTELIEIIEARNCMSLRSLIKFLILSQKFDLLDYCVSHVYVVNNLLLSSCTVPDSDSSCDVNERYAKKQRDNQPLKKQRFFKSVDDLLHDSVTTEFPDLVPKNRSQRRRLK